MSSAKTVTPTTEHASPRRKYRHLSEPSRERLAMGGYYLQALQNQIDALRSRQEQWRQWVLTGEDKPEMV